MKEYIPGSGIFTVDALYYRPELVSIHLIRSADRIAIVDTGTQYSEPQVRKALDQLDLDYTNVDFIMLTHIHLDHAGGASTLMQLCPNANLVVHPKGARHISQPEKLIAGSISVYGEAEFYKMYGQIDPIDPARIIQPKDGETIDFAGRALTFIDSPGHAYHHHCIIDQQSNSIFTGDTFGVGYRVLRSDDHAFLALSTTPVQFDPAALHASIDKIMSYEPQYLYLTHYSALKPTARIVAGLHEQIDDFINLTQQIADKPDGDFVKQLESAIADYLVQRCLNELPNIDKETAQQCFKLDAMLNAQGLAFWWQHKRAA